MAVSIPVKASTAHEMIDKLLDNTRKTLDAAKDLNNLARVAQMNSRLDALLDLRNTYDNGEKISL
jgi:hypothetical protein